MVTGTIRSAVSNLWIFLIVILISGLLGSGMRNLTFSLDPEMHPSRFPRLSSASHTRVKVGGSVGNIGGFRQVIANFYWLKSYHAWEHKNTAAAFHYANRACQLNPRQWFFRENTALMIAHDFPRWILRQEGMESSIQEEEWTLLRTLHGQWALDWLSQAEPYFIKDARLHLLSAYLALHLLEDASLASQYYRSAWEMGGSLMAARLHGELLRAEQRTADALEWYQLVAMNMSHEIEDGDRWTIEQRIRTLQQALSIPLRESTEQAFTE